MSWFNKQRNAGSAPMDLNQFVDATRVTNNFGPAPDLAEVLPEGARQRLELWREAAEDAHAAVRVAEDAALEAGNDLHRRKADLRRLAESIVPKQGGGGYRPGEDDPLFVQRRQAVEAAEKALAKAVDRKDRASRRWQHLSQLVQACETFLRSIPAGQTVRHVPMRPARSDTPEKIQAALATLRADLHDVRMAPISASEAKAAARAEIERLAEKGRIDPYPLLAGQGIGWPLQVLQVNPIGLVSITDQGGAHGRIAGTASAKAPDVLALLCWLFKDRLIAVAEAEIEAADDGSGLTAEEREARAAELEAKILEAERYLIAVCERDGLELPLDADPRALMQIEVEVAA